MSQTIESHEASFNSKEQRKALFSDLTFVIVLSRDKLNVRSSTDRNKQAWARVLISGVEAFGHLLETAQLDSLEERIEILEGVKNKLE